jgi:hypothetical protein
VTSAVLLVTGRVVVTKEAYLSAWKLVSAADRRDRPTPWTVDTSSAALKPFKVPQKRFPRPTANGYSASCPTLHARQ